MRLSKARVPPLNDSECTAEQTALIAQTKQRTGTVYNVNRTLMRNMALYTSWVPFARHTMNSSSLQPRFREILILRVACRTDCEYEWGQHVLMSGPAGLTAADHQRIKDGASAAGWSELEAALIRVADELLAECMISENTWNVLSRHLTTQEIIDTIFTVGQYNMVSMALNSLGIERDPGVPGFGL